MDIRPSGKNKVTATIYEYGEQAAIVDSRPSFFYLQVSFGEVPSEEKFGFVDFSEREPYGSNYPFELELSVRSLKRIRKNLLKLQNEGSDVEKSFGRMAALSAIDDFLEPKE